MGKINFRKYFLQNKRSANAAISRKKNLIRGSFKEEERTMSMKI